MKGLFGRRLRAMALLVIVSGLWGAQAGAKPARGLDIADAISANPILTKFAAMVQASGLATFLSSRGPFTIFAPTDAAFDRMTPEQFDTLLQPQNKVRLQDILLFHLVNGKRLYSKDLLVSQNLLSCEGDAIPVRTNRSGAEMVLNARIVRADLRCLNGVIHEIDTVLTPPESALPPLLPPAAITNAPPSDTNTPPVATPIPAPGADTNAPPVAPPASPEPAEQ
ncbi:MAG TPA: fasciclin domain-containing protein [Candidatus Methylacidiphilales bacterium]|nr:fasciclin domain-containing protein [Candidatus Methylacidiphilales bacterium]